MAYTKISIINIDMCITKCIDHFILTEPKMNATYVLISSLIFGITMVTICLIDRHTLLNSKIRNLTGPKIMLIQLPFLILLSTSISVCCINAFILKCKNNHSVRVSDLTLAESQLRDTARNCNREFVF